jgi:hypothetical protein
MASNKKIRTRPRLVSESCFDFLHIELVNLVKQQFNLGSGAAQPGGKALPTVANPVVVDDDDRKDAAASATDAKNNTAKPKSSSLFAPFASSNKSAKERDANRKRAFEKLRAMGFTVGERLAQRATQNTPFLQTGMDMVKFLCKDFWILVFRKQITKLQTNYKGMYVLQDKEFRWTSRLSCVKHPSDEAQLYTALACGLIQGALSNMTMSVTVRADTSKFPQCWFTVREVPRPHAALQPIGSVSKSGTSAVSNKT